MEDIMQALPFHRADAERWARTPNTDGPIRVLLADDHTMVREGLADLLASYGGMEVVGSIANGEEAVALASRERPDVVLMQVQMPFETVLDESVPPGGEAGFETRILLFSGRFSAA